LFALAGVTRLVWRNVGDACPICRALNGKTVAIDQPFATAGDVIGDLTVSRKTLHPPIHRACSCTIIRA
jgi:hypothetical protein